MSLVKLIVDVDIPSHLDPDDVLDEATLIDIRRAVQAQLTTAPVVGAYWDYP